MANHRSATRREDAGEKHQFVMDSLVEHETLQEHLLHQLGLSDVSDQDRPTAEMLIGNIDEDGFPRVSISRTTRCPPVSRYRASPVV